MRAPLSIASPAASSRVWPSTSWPRWSRTAGEQGVPAAGDQAEEGRLERLGLEEVGGDVALQVVDRDQRQPARGGDRLRRAEADEERADQPGPAVTATASTSSSRPRPPPAPPRPPARRARGGGGRRPPARRRRSARGRPPARRSRWRGSAGRRAPPRRCRRTRSRSQGSHGSARRQPTGCSSHMISASSPLSW